MSRGLVLYPNMLAIIFPIVMYGLFNLCDLTQVPKVQGKDTKIVRTKYSTKGGCCIHLNPLTIRQGPAQHVHFSTCALML